MYLHGQGFPEKVEERLLPPPISFPLKQQAQRVANLQPREMPNLSPALLAEEISCDALKQLGNTSLFPVSASRPAWCSDMREAEWYCPHPLSYLGLFIYVHTRMRTCRHADSSVSTFT